MSRPAGSPSKIADVAFERALATAALDAASIVLDAFGSDFEVVRKDDGSPVTSADRAAEDRIVEHVMRMAPGVAVVAEERVSADGPPDDLGDAFFLIDALDGTADFVKGAAGAGAFTVNIALIEAGVPTAGVVVAPQKARMWAGRAGAGAWASDVFAGRPTNRTPIFVGEPRDRDLVALVSSRPDNEIEAFLARYDIAERRHVGSSLKYGLISEGQGHLHARCTPTSQWDTAAGDAVVRASGGQVVTLVGRPLRYGGRQASGALSLNPPLAALGAAAFQPAGFSGQS